MLLCRAARWATLCRQAPKAAAVDAAQRVLWPAHAVPHRSTDMKAPRRCSVECAHGTGTCLRGRKGAPRARCGCTRGACWFFAKAVHSHGYAMASCMRNRTIALFTTRHLAEVPADLGRGIEGAQASTEQQPIVRLSSILGPCDTCIEYVLIEYILLDEYIGTYRDTTTPIKSSLLVRNPSYQARTAEPSNGSREHERGLCGRAGEW